MAVIPLDVHQDYHEFLDSQLLENINSLYHSTLQRWVKRFT